MNKTVIFKSPEDLDTMKIISQPNHLMAYVTFKDNDTPVPFLDTEAMTEEVADRTNIPPAFVELVLTMEDDFISGTNFIMSPDEIEALGAEDVFSSATDVGEDKLREGIVKCTGISWALVDRILSAEFDIMKEIGLVQEWP